MTLLHLYITMFHVKFAQKSIGKVNPLQTSCMSAFSRFSRFWSYINPKGNPIRNMANCSMGPGNFITCMNPKDPKGILNRNMVNCSMGPGDFITCIHPKSNPNRNMANCSIGPGVFITCMNPK